MTRRKIILPLPRKICAISELRCTVLLNFEDDKVGKFYRFTIILWRPLYKSRSRLRKVSVTGWVGMLSKDHTDSTMIVNRTMTEVRYKNFVIVIIPSFVAEPQCKKLKLITKLSRGNTLTIVALYFLPFTFYFSIKYGFIHYLR